MRVAGLTALAVALIAAPTTSIAAGQVAAGGGTACVAPQEHADEHAGEGARTTGHLHSDTSDIGPVERARTAAVMKRVVSRSARAATTSALPANILVPVYVHVIKGAHAGESRVSATKVRRVMEILRAAYRGDQSGYAADTRYSFTIKAIDFTRNDRWYHAGMNSPADHEMKRKLHRAGPRSLNLYINEPGGAQGLLGYARFPWQYQSRPYLDGVTVHVDSLPSGRFGGFNLGDTVVHEVGHWLGLFHTFQSSTGEGCDPGNDAVADTPAQIEPNGRRPALCDNPGNVCDPTQLLPLGGTLRDPVFNFMDYSSDRCMREFTQGQSERMDLEYALYRAT